MRVIVTNPEMGRGIKSGLREGEEHLVGFLEGKNSGRLAFATISPKFRTMAPGATPGKHFKIADMQIPKQWVFAVGPDGVLRCGPPDLATTPELLESGSRKAVAARQYAAACALRERYKDRGDAIQEIIIAWPKSRNAHEAGLIASRSVAMELLSGNIEPELARSKLQSLVEQIPTITPHVQPFFDQMSARIRGESQHDRSARLRDAAHHLSSTLHDAEQGRTPHTIDPRHNSGRSVERDPGPDLDR